MEKPNTPELDKMLKVREQAQIIGEFLDYMSERGTYMCDEDGNPTRLTTEQMIALFFEVDLVKAEKERQALLVAIRNQ